MKDTIALSGVSTPVSLVKGQSVCFTARNTLTGAGTVEVAIERSLGGPDAWETIEMPANVDQSQAAAGDGAWVLWCVERAGQYRCRVTSTTPDYPTDDTSTEIVASVSAMPSARPSFMSCYAAEEDTLIANLDAVQLALKDIHIGANIILDAETAALSGAATAVQKGTILINPEGNYEIETRVGTNIYTGATDMGYCTIAALDTIGNVLRHKCSDSQATKADSSNVGQGSSGSSKNYFQAGNGSSGIITHFLSSPTEVDKIGADFFGIGLNPQVIIREL